MLSGVIITLTDRGFGLIGPDSGDKRDLFFRSDELRGVAFEELKCGDAVAFEVVATERGPAAHRVERLIETPAVTARHELPPPPPIVFKALQECTAELVEYLTKHPDGLRALHPGTFENLVEAIFRHEGFATERISRWNEPDGGVDLIAVRHVSPGFDVRLAIQCKTWGQARKISAEPLRSLAGVLDRFRVHAGVVATTGFFSEEAEKERTSYLWRISLRNYNDILESLTRLRLTQ